MINAQVTSGSGKKRIPRNAWIAGAFVLLAAVIAPAVTYLLNRPSEPPRSGIRIETVNSQSQDYVVLKNHDDNRRDISFYEVVEASKRFQIPSGTFLDAHASLRIWFLKEEEAGTRDVVSDCLVSSAFRIKSGETILLLDNTGNIVDEKEAP